jgi:hypothetical protein
MLLAFQKAFLDDVAANIVAERHHMARCRVGGAGLEHMSLADYLEPDDMLNLILVCFFSLFSFVVPLF